MRRFKGFTLTELMIALAVVGILVAVVTPAIMKTRPNKNKMMIKKSFYTTEQIVSSLINDERLYPDMRDACDTGDAAECAYGFDDYDKVSYEGEDYEGDTKFADLFKSKLNVKKEDSTYVFYTADGIKWDLSDADSKVWTRGTKPSDAGVAKILIDVNGTESPNCRQNGAACSADDFDQYQIEIYSNGKLKISDSDTKAIDFVTINTSIKDSAD